MLDSNERKIPIDIYDVSKDNCNSTSTWSKLTQITNQSHHHHTKNKPHPHPNSIHKQTCHNFDDASSLKNLMNNANAIRLKSSVQQFQQEEINHVQNLSPIKPSSCSAR